jgi:hypothetical protein
MPDYTKYLNLEKPYEDEGYDIGVHNNNADKIDEEINKLQTSSVVVDKELSLESGNPVENKVITEEFQNYAIGPGLEFGVVNGILNVTYDDGEGEHR